ncbi:glycosyltransferase family 4 protein [Neptunicella sp.]|uniref:glycosyltransferase family 4 protein n=1 Tax=Neptunicella sp. TaxID=2125986 RepID=UPI003F68E5B6
MKILIIGYVWPEPNSSAAGSRMMALINSFVAEQWQVTFASPAQLSEHRTDLKALDIDEVSIELNNGSFDEFILKLKPDMVMFDRFMMEEQFGWRVEKHCPDALRILDMEDAHFLRQARQQAFKKQQTLAPQDLHTELAIREIAAIHRCDITLVISKFEMALLQNQFGIPASILHYCPFMLDGVHADNPDFEQRQHFISIGNFRHEPNWDAVLWLKQQIWPLIRKQLPQAELHVYGAYPPKKATDLHHPKQGFLVKGWVEDAKKVMQQARICLAPLRFGAGLKGKLADAMQCGTPNITTDIGAEGFIEDDQWSGIIANEADNFADAAVSLYSARSQWQQYQQNGYDVIEQRFAKVLIQKQFIQQINHIVENLAEHRQRHFTGMMLRHHSMKSTQYMAQWIEAKNSK